MMTYKVWKLISSALTTVYWVIGRACDQNDYNSQSVIGHWMTWNSIGYWLTVKTEVRSNLLNSLNVTMKYQLNWLLVIG